MSRPLEIDVKAQVECRLRLTLEYLIAHAHLRELFSIQEMLSRHAADAAWHLSQQAFAMPKDYQEMPPALRQQMAEIERHNARLQATMEQANCTPAHYRQEG